MQSSFKTYSYLDSVSKTDEILDAPAGNYQEKDSIPSRDLLTFTNGFYVNCTCIFMDIKGSSELPSKHQRPRLAKIYRSFISEAAAVLNGSTLCSEVNIHGDAVWAVYEGQYKRNIDSAFSTCAELASLIKILNCRLRKRNIDATEAESVCPIPNMEAMENLKFSECLSPQIAAEVFTSRFDDRAGLRQAVEERRRVLVQRQR